MHHQHIPVTSKAVVATAHAPKGIQMFNSSAVLPKYEEEYDNEAQQQIQVW